MTTTPVLVGLSGADGVGRMPPELPPPRRRHIGLEVKSVPHQNPESQHLLPQSGCELAQPVPVGAAAAPT
jgi:hypothetical protein